MTVGSLKFGAWTRGFSLACALAFVSCGKSSVDSEGLKATCAPKDLPALSGGATSGSARAFLPDPISQTGQRTLLPTAGDLDAFPSNVTLEHLGGHGVLEGSYVAVQNGTGCDLWFGAYDPAGNFVYPHSDPRFQEAMTYYFSDQYRAKLDQYGYLQQKSPVTIVSHCLNEDNDNAFYLKAQGESGQIIELVCLGDSAATPGASYSDDAQVVLHELQHATTTDTYSLLPDVHLGVFKYDEAGVINEAISDFMALITTEPLLAPSLDPRVFSRWALGTFIPGRSGIRGANKCPTYDPTYPECTSFPAFSATNNTLSYVYPDGMGWPYANNYKGPGYVASAFNSYTSQQEIHGAATLIEGALWDVYVALNKSHEAATRLVLEAVSHLPKPNSVSASPVTARELANQLVAYAPAQDRDAVEAALTARGLVGGTPLPSDWAAVGPGDAGVTPGMRIQDKPDVLDTWLREMFKKPPTIPQSVATGLNNKLDPGELAAVWFDLQNVNAQTAGGIQLTVTALDPEVSFDSQLNDAVAGTNVAQIQYAKVNGTTIVKSLTSSKPAFHVPTGNTYFMTDPFFDRSRKTADLKRIGLPTTALWLRVSPNAPHGKTVRFRVEAQPSNGAASTVEFTATIN